jgi:hypothetical protein
MGETHESSAMPPQRHVSPPGTTGPGQDEAGQHASKKSSRSARGRAAPSESKLLAIVVDAETARVVRVEGVDDTGGRHELPESEKTVLVKRGSIDSVEDMIQQAFEAGIACVLDVDAEPEAAEESAEDADLRGRLLAPLIERSAVRRLLEAAVLDRAILNTLIEHSAT